MLVRLSPLLPWSGICMGKRTRNHRGRRTSIVEHASQPLWARNLWSSWSDLGRADLIIIVRALQWLLALVEEKIAGLTAAESDQELGTDC